MCAEILTIHLFLISVCSPLFFRPNEQRAVATVPAKHTRQIERLIVSTVSGKSLRGTALISVNAAGIGQEVLRDTTALYFDPVWSPDGKSIAFACLRHPSDRRTDIYVVKGDGTGLRPLTHSKTDEIAGSPTWSPDGKRICYHVKQRIPTIPMEGKSHLYVVRLNGSSPKQVGPGSGTCSQVFSPGP
jgi:Tol biopolymer transport system component